MSFVTLKKQGRAALMTLQRTDALNALNTQLLQDLDAAVCEIERDHGITAVILTGTGRAFAAGADIAEMRRCTAPEGKRFSAYGSEVFLRLEALPAPVIAAVNGFALGGGCELAMACDIRLASKNAAFGQPEVGLGITPGFGGTQRLARICGVSKAMELILTGRIIHAEEAKAIGLVSEVCEPEALLPRAWELAELICRNAPIAVQEAKKCIRFGMQADIRTACAFESESFGLTCATEDRSEGMDAFLERRFDKHFIGG